MPSTSTDGRGAAAPDAPLFRRLLDDAAVFPPAALPLPDAVRGHVVHRTGWYAACVGPLLVPASAVADLLEAAPRDGTALAVVVVARPGADPAALTAGLDALRDEPHVRVVGAELAWQDGWRDLGLDDLPLALELPRGTDQPVAVADVHTAVDEGRPVVAKFRTGPTATWTWPDAAELATVLGLVTGLAVPFKLTGGLHHAARGTYEVAGAPEENHGVLNVLLATAAALEGAGVEEIAAVLEVREAEALAALVRAWTPGTAVRVRRAFTAYGCCTVTDPLGELADLGVLAPYDRPDRLPPDEGPP